MQRQHGVVRNGRLLHQVTVKEKRGKQACKLQSPQDSESPNTRVRESTVTQCEWLARIDRVGVDKYRCAQRTPSRVSAGTTCPSRTSAGRPPQNVSRHCCPLRRAPHAASTDRATADLVLILEGMKKKKRAVGECSDSVALFLPEQW